MQSVRVVGKFKKMPSALSTRALEFIKRLKVLLLAIFHLVKAIFNWQNRKLGCVTLNWITWLRFFLPHLRKSRVKKKKKKKAFCSLSFGCFVSKLFFKFVLSHVRHLLNKLFLWFRLFLLAKTGVQQNLKFKMKIFKSFLPWNDSKRKRPFNESLYASPIIQKFLFTLINSFSAGGSF